MNFVGFRGVRYALVSRSVLVHQMCVIRSAFECKRNMSVLVWTKVGWNCKNDGILCNNLKKELGKKTSNIFAHQIQFNKYELQIKRVYPLTSCLSIYKWGQQLPTGIIQSHKNQRDFVFSFFFFSFVYTSANLTRGRNLKKKKGKKRHWTWTTLWCVFFFCFFFFHVVVTAVVRF